MDEDGGVCILGVSITKRMKMKEKPWCVLCLGQASEDTT